jgi:hypothetical protein
MKSTESLSVDELVAEANRLRVSLSETAEQLQGICDVLSTKVRRQGSGVLPSAYSYLNFANAGRRFAGAVVQGVRRTASFDRMLATAKADEAEAEAREAKKKEESDKREQRKQKEEAARRADEERRARLFGDGADGDTEEALIALYGED